MFHDTGADWSISKSDSIELILVLVDLFFILENLQLWERLRLGADGGRRRRRPYLKRS